LDVQMMNDEHRARFLNLTNASESDRIFDSDPELPVRQSAVDSGSTCRVVGHSEGVPILTP